MGGGHGSGWLQQQLRVHISIHDQEAESPLGMNGTNLLKPQSLHRDIFNKTTCLNPSQILLRGQVVKMSLGGYSQSTHCTEPFICQYRPGLCTGRPPHPIKIYLCSLLSLLFLCLALRDISCTLPHLLLTKSIWWYFHYDGRLCGPQPKCIWNVWARI